MAAQLFLSYARKDREQIMPWVHRLQAVRVTVWVDESGIDAALRWSQEIVEAIEGCQAFVLLVSPASVASEHVTREVALAMDYQKPILPLFLEPTTVPVALRYPLAGLQHLELFRGGSEENLASILRSLGRLGVMPEPPQQPVGGEARSPEPAPEGQPGPSESMDGAAAAPEKAPHNLPFELTTFIGREQEMAEVNRLLSGTALLTLVGGGGCGKTRLALQVATDLLSQYPDGVWLVELEAVENATFVVQTIASTLGVREEPGHPLTETLAEFLKSRSTLLLLDNCEHLVVPCAQLVQTLLRSCPHLRVMATSREALGVRGEVVMRVPTLSLPSRQSLAAGGDLVAAVMRYEAIQLFVERAGTAQPNFTVTPQNAAVVAQVCLRLDGIPLALELAAARVKVLSVEQIAQRLDDQFRLLTGGSRTALPRQQTLRAAIDWSYELLTEPERALLQRLSVFMSGWTMAAAETVCAGEVIEEWEVLDLLTQLVDKSLVVVEEGIEQEPRYRLLETIRAYARGRLGEGGEDAAVRQRHAEFFLALAEQAEKELLGPAPATWLGQLETEHDNLRAALGWAVETQNAEVGLRLGGALWRFWHDRGHLREGRERLEAVLAMPSASDRNLVRARALNGAGALAHDQGDLDRAAALHEEGLAIAREAGDQDTIAYSLLSLGNVAIYQEDYERAKSLNEEALALGKSLGNQSFVATLLNNLAYVAGLLGQIDNAVALFEESLALKRQMGNRVHIATTLQNLGDLAIDQGNHERAAMLLDESLRLSYESGYRRGVFYTLNALAKLACMQGDLVHAACLLATVANLSELIGAVLPYDHEQNVARARAGLSEEEFAAAWRKGQAMTLEETIAAASPLAIAA